MKNENSQLISSTNPEIGTITWTDLTIENAKESRDFYNEIIGWKSTPFNSHEKLLNTDFIDRYPYNLMFYKRPHDS